MATDDGAPAPTTVEADYEQLGPFIDALHQYICRLKRSPFERATLLSLLVMGLAAFARQEMVADAHEPIGDPLDRLRLAKLLATKTEEAAQLLLETERAYAQAGRVQ